MDKKKKKKGYWKFLVTALIFVGMVVVYYLFSSSESSNSYLFPSGDRIIDAFVTDKDTFGLNALGSFELLIPSLVIAILLSLVIGVPLGLNSTARDIMYPVLYVISVVPAILLSPFALLLAPSFRAASLFLIVYGCMFPTVFATITGIQTIDKRYLDRAKTLELKGIEKVTKVILPAASPSIFAGLVTTMRGAFLMLVYSEMYGAQFGLGYYVRKYSEFGMYANTWAGFIFMVIILVLVMYIFERVKDHMLKWSIN